LLRTQKLVSDARLNVRLYSTIKDRKSPLKGSRPSVPHGTNFSVVVLYIFCMLYFAVFVVLIPTVATLRLMIMPWLEL